MITDVSERKLARAQKQVQILEQMIEDKTRELFITQEELRSAKEYFESIIRSMQDLLIVLRPEGTIQSVNERAVSLLGYQHEDELIGQFITKVLNDQEGFHELFLNVDDLEGPFNQRESSFIGKAGNSFPVLLSGSTLRDKKGKSCGLVLLALDIQERKILEQQLLQAQKMESIGQLAAGMAHEINTPIQFIGDNTRFLQEAFCELQPVLDHSTTLVETTESGSISIKSLDGIANAVKTADLPYLSEEIPKAIAQTLEGVERVSSIVRAMKEFSHPGVEGKTSADINSLIDNTIVVSRNEWKYVADIKTEFAPDLPQITCFAGQLSQVFLNLIVNAAHAIAEIVEGKDNETGTIRIATRIDNQWLEISVCDTGGGIPEQIRDKIFDPFFTTKPVGTGTGQGLALVHDIVVEKHQGTIVVESSPDMGTTFLLRLPINPVLEDSLQERMDTQNEHSTAHMKAIEV